MRKGTLLWMNGMLCATSTRSWKRTCEIAPRVGRYCATPWKWSLDELKYVHKPHEHEVVIERQMLREKVWRATDKIPVHKAMRYDYEQEHNSTTMTSSNVTWWLWKPRRYTEPWEWMWIPTTFEKGRYVEHIQSNEVRIVTSIRELRSAMRPWVSYVWKEH